MKHTSIAFVVFIMGFCFILAQEKEKQNPRDIFLEAESYLLYEEYSEALPLYLKLSKADPANDNLNYKVGLCFLSIPYEKERAIVYLEKAVKNISQTYRPNNFKETQAPLDALFYLGNAYRINNQLDKALEKYHDFKKQIDPEIFDETLVDEQIATIERAKRYQSKPLRFEPKNLGEKINSKFAETNAVVSTDERTLVYNVKLQFYDALFFSVRDDNSWSDPINIIPDLGVDGDVYATSLSSDGKELYIYRSDNFDGNIYVSKYVNDRWTPIKRLNENINTKFWESHASVSADGKYLYFTSNRKGGLGGLDIYVSKRDDIGADNWQKPVNLGHQVNTSYNEETPFLTEDGSTLYFSSYGHFNMGGYDIFYSNKLDDGHWSAPLSMAYPINTTDDDLFFVPVKNGNFAYICRYYPDLENYGRTDIFRAEIYSDQHPRKFILKGLLSLPAGVETSNAKLVAYIINRTSRDTVQMISIDPKKAKFDSKLEAGNYQLVVQGEGLEKSSQDFSIDKNQSSGEYTLKTTMKEAESEEQPVKEIQPEKSELTFNQNIFVVNNGNVIRISLDLPVGTEVKVDISIDSVAKEQERFIVQKNPSNFDYKPVVGNNLLKFKALTPDNKLKEGVVMIIYNAPADSTTENQPVIAYQEAQLNYMKQMLSSMAQGKIAARIKKLDGTNNLRKEEFLQLLKTFAIIDSFAPADVDSLMAQYLREQKLAAKLYVSALKEVSSPKLAAYIDNVCKGKEFNDVFEVVDILLNDPNIQKEQYELVTINSNLADNADVYYYLDAMRKTAPESMKNALNKTNLQELSIISPEGLFDYLYERQKIDGYAKDDIFDACFALPLYTDPASFLELMKSLAQEPLFSVLNNASLNEKNLKSAKALGSLLKKLAVKNDIPETSIIKLFIKANSAHYYNVYKEDLSLFSTGKLKELLSKFAIEENKSDNTIELLHWMLKYSNDKQYKDDMVLTFAQMASRNLINTYHYKVDDNNKELRILQIVTVSVFGIIMMLVIIGGFRNRKKEEE